MSPTQILIALIAQHGFEARATPTGIEALALWTDGEGNPGSTWEPLPLSTKAVFEWLGY